MARLDTSRPTNRVLDAILFYQAETISHQAKQPIPVKKDKKGAMLERQYYKSLLTSIKKPHNDQEKATRNYLRYNIRILKLRTQPKVLDFLLWPLQFAWDLIFGNYRDTRQQELLILQAHKEVSNQQSVILINQQLQQNGFTQNINPYLQKMMDQGIDRFHYRYMDMRHPDTEYVLYFSKSNGSSLYRFERFEAAVVTPWQNSAQQIPRYFSFNDTPGIQMNATEAAHLVNGRAIAIEGASNQWIVADKANTASPFQVIEFDLEATLKQTPLPPMNSMEYNHLVQTLRSGSTKDLVYTINGAPVNYTLQVSPSRQTVYITDQYNQLVNPKDLQKTSANTTSEKLVQQAESVQQQHTPRMTVV